MQKLIIEYLLCTGNVLAVLVTDGTTGERDDKGKLSCPVLLKSQYSNT